MRLAPSCFLASVMIFPAFQAKQFPRFSPNYSCSACYLVGFSSDSNFEEKRRYCLTLRLPSLPIVQLSCPGGCSESSKSIRQSMGKELLKGVLVDRKRDLYCAGSFIYYVIENAWLCTLPPLLPHPLFPYYPRGDRTVKICEKSTDWGSILRMYSRVFTRVHLIV